MCLNCLQCSAEVAEEELHLFKIKNIYTYATLVWILRWKSWNSKMMACPILIFMQSFVKFQMMVQEIQIKRSTRELPTYILTIQVIESAWADWKLVKKVPGEHEASENAGPDDPIPFQQTHILQCDAISWDQFFRRCRLGQL